MSLDEYHSAKLLIEEMGGDFEGPKSEALIESAERVLGLTLPPSYRRFLLDLGCGDINGLEIYGVINERFEDSRVPDAIWLTLNERKSIGLDPAFVLIGDSGDGAYYAINTRMVDESGESPVVLLSMDGAQLKHLAASFGEYLLHALRSVA